MKIDLHLHTSLGSACSYMDPDQAIEQARKIGLDGICLTDHDHIWSEDYIERLRKKHDFLVIGGSEVATDMGEILVFGLHRSVRTIHTARELRRIVDQVQGAMVLAHPFRSEPHLIHYRLDHSRPNDPPEIFQEISQRPVFQLVDAMEVFNGQSTRAEKKFTRTVAEYLDIPGTGGSDAHAILGLGYSYTVFDEQIDSERDLIEEINNGKFHGEDQLWNE
ncbi:MAG: PHP domain-containing protein [Proteobacteria bacterium]|nr:PHP domain-containing protein [Pseudomonadota bacterium]